ncbi:MAG: hypothetical protein IKW70_06980 [Verrucomicrobia bacterium]|nr:hypothetical protein [Verrucomicrobiota bacterium]
MTARQVKRIQIASGLIFNPFRVKSKGSSVMKYSWITAWALPLIFALTFDLSQSGCGSVPKDPPPSSIKTSQTQSETDGEEAIPPSNTPQNTEPLIIWGEDGVPVLNETALAENAAQKEKEREEEVQTDRKKQKRKKKTDESEKISGLTGTDNKNVSFVVRTNMPVAEASTKTRMQEFYEFTSRVNKKHNLSAIPDMADTNTQENLPLFSEEELTAINDLNGSVRLMTSFETKIRLVNDNLRFIVLDYSYEPMPPLETRLAVYRDGQRIGMVKVTGPVMNGSTIAIIVEGEPQVGDTVLRETW